MGGLGNQLFCYAAARRAALMLGAELLIDSHTGFVRERTYNRKYELDCFRIPCRKATRWERMEPFERGRRAIAKTVNRLKPYSWRGYVVERTHGFDARLLHLKPGKSRYLEGLWQDERYFSDIESQLREDLRFKHQLVPEAQGNTVAVHVRWFDPATSPAGGRNLGLAYYAQAFRYLEARIPAPRYRLFSDDIPAALALLKGLGGREFHADASEAQDASEVLCRMSQCRHFVAANSTFSWWAAWLGRSKGGITLIPEGMPSLQGSMAWKLDDVWIAR